MSRSTTASVPSISEILVSNPSAFVKKHPDIAAVNLACARGLKTIDEDAFPDYLALIDKIADAVEKETQRCFRLFQIKPAQFLHSEAVFRMYTMEHVFRVQFGIKYDPLVQHQLEKQDHWQSKDSSEIFIHGILSEKRTGTCSSLPTFAIAVGRRLGYPLKLVLVPNHTLYRWDDGNESLNYQHTDAGGDIRPDVYFLTWPRRWTDDDRAINQRTKVWLHSMTSKQEVSKFLCNRAIILGYSHRYDEAILAIDAAIRFSPINPACQPIRRHLLHQRSKTNLSPLPRQPNSVSVTSNGLMPSVDHPLAVFEELALKFATHFPQSQSSFPFDQVRASLKANLPSQRNTETK